MTITQKWDCWVVYIYTFNFVRNCQNVFQSSCTILHFYQQCMRSSAAANPRHHLVRSFLIFQVSFCSQFPFWKTSYSSSFTESLMPRNSPNFSSGKCLNFILTLENYFPGILNSGSILALGKCIIWLEKSLKKSGVTIVQY